MAVASRGAALSAFRELINRDPVEARTILRRPYLPSGLEPSDDPVRMDPSTLIGGYGNEARYTFGAADPETTRAIADRPSEVLSGRPSITSDTVAAYARASLDLTMEGGTTSGVVYPLAVCELATEFRFRNVGGASAGAIAAALTAAAELGRSSRVLASGGLGSGTILASTEEPSATTNGNHIRRGFTGMTDIIGWLTQTRPGDSERDEYRLAQLFRPGRATAAIFRVAVAVMRGQSWPLPLLALSAFGWAPACSRSPDLSVPWSRTGTGVAVHRRGPADGPGDGLVVGGCSAGWLRRHRRRRGACRPGNPIWTPQASGERWRTPGRLDWVCLRNTSAYATPRSDDRPQLIIGAPCSLRRCWCSDDRPAGARTPGGPGRVGCGHAD